MAFSDIPEGDELEPFRTIPALVDALNAGADRPSWTVSAVRNLLAQRERNGLAQFVVKQGRKVLVSEPGFRYWVRTPQQFRLDLQEGAANEVL